MCSIISREQRKKVASSITTREENLQFVINSDNTPSFLEFLDLYIGERSIYSIQQDKDRVERALYITSMSKSFLASIPEIIPPLTITTSPINVLLSIVIHLL